MKKDVLIVGQGLAGTTLAFALRARGMSVHIIDDDHATASSLVQIAVINPVTGRRYAKSWNIDALIPTVEQFYTEVAGILNKKYLSRIEIFQILPDARIEEIWMLRCGDPEYQPFLDPQISSLQQNGVHPVRYALIRNAHHLEISHFIKDAAEWLSAQGILSHAIFDPAALRLSNDGIVYQDTSYQHIVFCEGHRVIRDPLFKSLEIYPMKGEYLICRIPGFGLMHHLKTNISIIPLAEKDLYWCGATYDRYNDNPDPSSSAREYLLRQLAQIVHLPVTIEYHGVGIRATTRDRRPYVGTHPDHDRVHLIAGLGTKGASLAPFCAQSMTAYLSEGKEIPEEIHIGRHMQ